MDCLSLEQHIDNTITTLHGPQHTEKGLVWTLNHLLPIDDERRALRS
jgi:hypothetical protein